MQRGVQKHDRTLVEQLGAVNRKFEKVIHRRKLAIWTHPVASRALRGQHTNAILLRAFRVLASPIMTVRRQHEEKLISRRAVLKNLGLAPLLLRAAPFHGSGLLLGPESSASAHEPSFPFSDVRLRPQYPTKSQLADVIRFVAPGSDEYATEKSAVEIEAILQRWSKELKVSPEVHAELAGSLNPAIAAAKLGAATESSLRSGYGLEIVGRHFDTATVSGRELFIKEVQAWLEPISHIETAEFEVYSLTEIAGSPLKVSAGIRYDLVSTRKDGRREERVGNWQTEWSRTEAGSWMASRWEASEETLSIARGPAFLDVTDAALGGTESYKSQMLRGVDHWRTVLDGACGIDIYSNNGVAAGDFDNDGFDDIYVCQPAGLPNRLYRNRGDGSFEDVTEQAGVAVLDNTACALFADFRNKGVQDLLIVCGSGPLLFLNQGDGTFVPKRDAFKFKRPPQGTFTHAALADYDRDGLLDIYFCTYQYYLGLDQYHYPVPYFDARNGPPNCLLHNEGDGTFVERTHESGLDADNDRYSFACAWGDSNSNGLPDLCVANDFGSTQLYRNSGDGTFKVASGEAHVEDVGAGMSACWADVNNDGNQDIYITSMWEAAGQRVSEQPQFHAAAPEAIRSLYRRHARGNALYRNQGDGTFKNVGHDAGVEMGRWSWSADFWDFDHDGFQDLCVTNGYITAQDKHDLASFFWRQVVAKSPEDAVPSGAYERGWNAINELIRSDSSWNAYERNLMFANHGDGTFSEVSGLLGMDWLEDSRSFALADIDGDGRLEVILKNRNAPQLRVLHNAMTDIGQGISFRLKGVKSNRDAIGAAVAVAAGTLRQTKYLQAGTGFLAQHSKELFFGVGSHVGTVSAKIRWPSGLSQQLDNLPVGHRIDVEEGNNSFSAHRYAPTSKAYVKTGAPPALEPPPRIVETWLIEPLKAPEFTLPDSAGRMRRLGSLRGGFVLLNFWASTAPVSLDQLKMFHRRRSGLSAVGLTVLTVNVDEAGSLPTAKAFAAKENLSISMLFATEEVAGTYNIIYRYLFDRRRDLGIPTSFLIDKEGMIVKVYQGPLDPVDLVADVGSVPTTSTQRMAKALPMKGEVFQVAFRRNDFTYGVAMFQHGYLDRAAEAFQQVIAAKPGYAEAYYNLGTLNLRRNDFAQARLYLEQTVKLRSDYPEAWNNLGMIAAHEGHTEEAVHNFQRSIELRPTYAIALLNLGNVYRRQRNFAESEVSLDRALTIEPADPEINYSLGMLYAQQEQSPRAQEYLQKAIALRPAYPEALNNLGVLFVQLQEYSRAEQQFKTCIRLVPDFDQSYFNLARLESGQGNKDKAKEILLRLLKLQPQNKNVLQALNAIE